MHDPSKAKLWLQDRCPSLAGINIRDEEHEPAPNLSSDWVIGLILHWTSNGVSSTVSSSRSTDPKSEWWYDSLLSRGEMAYSVKDASQTFWNQSYWAVLPGWLPLVPESLWSPSYICEVTYKVSFSSSFICVGFRPAFVGAFSCPSARLDEVNGNRTWLRHGIEAKAHSLPNKSCFGRIRQRQNGLYLKTKESEKVPISKALGLKLW